MTLFTMKRGGGFIVLLAVIALAFAVGACKTGTDGVTTNEDASGVDFTNYTTDAAFRVRNGTNQSLVLFKGNLQVGNILGGVPPNGGGDGWAISKTKNQKHFSTTGEFALIVLTLDQYKENKDKLYTQENTPFTRVYVFYNTAGENAILYDISDKLGGNFILSVENPTSFNIELREGGVNGPTLGYAPAGMQATRLRVNAGDLDIFPVFKYYNAARNIVETIYPKGTSGRPWMDAYVFGDGYASPQVHDIREALKGISGRTSGVAYLKIVNSSTGAVRFYKGTTMVYNTAGISYMPNGGVSTEFEILMPGSNDNFDDKITISDYKVGPTGGAVPIVVKGTSTSTFELETDKSYTVTVTGSYNADSLKAEIDLDNPTDVSFDIFTGWN